MGRIGRRISGRTASCSFWLCSCLAVFVLHIFAFRQTGGQPLPQEAPSGVNRFLDEMEWQVMEIAAEAAANYEKTTELVTTCGDPGNCSRDICSPLKGELESLSCVNLVNNSNCPSPGPGSQFCNTGLVTYWRSYVRIPRAQLLGIPAEVSTAICVQRNLEPLFKKFHQNTSYGTAFVNSKLATIDGTQRFYPGRELTDCAGTYDPRRRPWFAGAISVKKRLVILLDNGQSMNTLVWHTPDTSAFEVARNTTSALLWTLTPEDEASVTLFAAIATQLFTVSVPETGLNASTPQSVDDELKAQTVSQGASNLTAGLTSALSFLKMGDEDALKVIVVFTDGSLGDELNQSELEPLLEEIKTNNVTVLVFVLGGQSTSTSFETLKTLACSRLSGQMSVEVFTEVGNPMFGLRNLFSFFARAHLQVDQGRPFWQSQYTNYDNLGDAVDVSYPAMTKNNQLIGVASVGIQVKGLSPTLQGNLGPALADRAHKYPINPRPTGLLCQPEEDTFAISGYSKDGTTGICPSTRQHSFKDLSCCQQCGGLKLNKSTFSSGVRAAVIAGATLLGVAVLLWLLWFWSWRSKQLPPPPKPPILPQPVHAEESRYL